MYGVKFFMSHGMQAFIALGGVVLALTGAEALYADMGHFGKRPIRLAWFGFVLPALVLNYFGQGALLLDHPDAIDNPFFKLVPKIMLYPMIGLATIATVIASQAVISGAFSMTREAMSLGYSMRMPIVHTSREMSGQIFVPWVNTFLLVMVLIAVLGFRSSENLSAAYGIAVTGTMTVTTILALVVARYQWHWSRPTVIFAGLLLLTIDLSFLSANVIKIEYGGWFPLVLGVAVFVVMTTWRRGRELVVREIKQSGLALQPFIENVGEPAQPQAQQGAARAQRAADGGDAGDAGGRRRGAHPPDPSGRQLLRAGAALRLRRGSEHPAGAAALLEGRPAVRHDGHHLLPVARNHHRRRAPAGHGAVARQAVRLHGPQRAAGHRVLPDPGQPADRAGRAGRDLSRRQPCRGGDRE
jgi:hypothetical protein